MTDSDTPNVSRATSASPTPSRVEVALRRGCWGLIALWSLSSLWYPFGWDQGIFAWVGHTILSGGMPYLDVFEIKGPLVYYLFALVEWVFGRNTWGIHLSELLLLFVAAFFLTRAVERYTDHRVARWAAPVFVLWFASLSFWHTAQPDGWAMMILTIGFVPLLLEPGAVGRVGAFGAGLAVGAATLLKPNYIVFLLVPTVWVLTDAKWSPSRTARRLAVVGLGSAVPLGVALAWFAYRGAFDALLEVHIKYNAAVYASGGGLDLESRARGVLEYMLTGRLVTVLLAPALLGAYELYRREKQAMWTLAAWALLATAGVALQNKFFEYQWTPIFAPVLILAAVGMYSALGNPDDAPSHRGPARSLAIALFLVALLNVTVRPLSDVANWAAYMIGARSPEAFHDVFGVPGIDYRVAEYIRQQARPDDKLVVVGWNAELLLMTELDTVSRFHYSLPLWMGDGTAEQKRYRREFMEAVQLQPPEFVVVAPQAERLVGRIGALEDFPELFRFINSRYSVDREIAGLVLYRLVTDPPTP